MQYAFLKHNKYHDGKNLIVKWTNTILRTLRLTVFLQNCSSIEIFAMMKSFLMVTLL